MCKGIGSQQEKVNLCRSRPQVNTKSETDWNCSIQIYFVWKWEERGEIFYFSFVRWVNIKDNILCNYWPLRRLMMFNVYSFVLNTTKTAWAQTFKSRLFIYCSPCQQMKSDSTIVFPMTRSHCNVFKCNDEFLLQILDLYKGLFRTFSKKKCNITFRNEGGGAGRLEFHPIW